MMIRIAALVVSASAFAAIGCSAPPVARAPLQMEKIEVSAGSGSYQTAPPLALHEKIPNASSANDLQSAGPKVAEPPKQKAKTESRFAPADHYVDLSKHDSLPVGGNDHGTLTN